MQDVTQDGPVAIVAAGPSPADEVARRREARRSWTKLLLSFVCLGVVTLAEVCGWYLGDLTPLGSDLSYELAGALAAVACLVALGGRRLLRPTAASTRDTWQLCWWFIVVSAALLVLDLYEMLVWGEAVEPGWPLRLAQTAALCLAIGVCEECMLRGILLSGLLAPLGGRKAGVWAAVIASSVYFGLLHVDFVALDAGNPLELAQAALKVGQTGVYGFALACCVVDTGDVLTPALVHGLDDFLLLFVSDVLLGESVSDVSYVSTDTGEAIYTIGLYLVMIVLYLPPAIRAARRLAARMG